MYFILTFVIIGLSIVLTRSIYLWKLGNSLLERLDLSNHQVYENLTVSGSAQLKLGESLGIPMQCSLILNENNLHLVASKFSPFLFMTNFPYTFEKEKNQNIKMLRSEVTEIKFIGEHNEPGIYGSSVEVTIRAYELKEKALLLKEIKNWSNNEEV